MSGMPMSFRRWTGSKHEKAAEDLEELNDLHEIIASVDAFAKVRRKRGKVFVLITKDRVISYFFPKDKAAPCAK